MAMVLLSCNPHILEYGFHNSNSIAESKKNNLFIRELTIVDNNKCNSLQECWIEWAFKYGDRFFDDTLIKADFKSLCISYRADSCNIGHFYTYIFPKNELTSFKKVGRDSSEGLLSMSLLDTTRLPGKYYIILQKEISAPKDTLDSFHIE